VIVSRRHGFLRSAGPYLADLAAHRRTSSTAPRYPGKVSPAKPFWLTFRIAKL